MQWLQSNWIWIAMGVAFIAMHLFGHGMHGGHGGHNRNRPDGPSNLDKDDMKNTPGAGPIASVPSVGASADPAPGGNAMDHVRHGSAPTDRNGPPHKHGC